METTKKCRDCQTIKNIDEFSFSLCCTDKLRPECKLCYNEQSRAKYAANREERLALDRLKRRQNPERGKQKHKRYYEKHRVKELVRLSARRANKLQRTPKWLTSLHKTQISMFYEAAVAITQETGTLFEVDHIVPLNGKNVSGLHVPWNLQVITAEENAAKFNKLTGDY